MTVQALDGRLHESAAELPDSVRWSLGDATLCGLQGYMRPCQMVQFSLPSDSSYPLAQICETDAEMVFVVDDDDDLRTNLVELVESLGYPATGCVSASELQELAPKWKSGCILLDVKLPGQDGLAVQEWLNRTGIVLPVIFISGIQDVGTVVHCMKSGAVEFLQKPFGEMALRRAVSSAVGLSRKRFCAEESKRLIRRLLDNLTPTELFVARKISKGYPTKLIAAEMGRSENTVKIHRHRIFHKLKVNSAASVANLIRHGELADERAAG